MAIQLSNEYGSVHVSDEVLAVMAGSAALECYGLIGMATRKQLKDGIAELLGRDNLSRGVEVRQEQNGVVVDIYIIVSYGTKISEVAHNVQNRVKYVLSHVVGLDILDVNIYVQDVRVVK